MGDAPRALVTGAGQRLGRAIALDLARAGYDLVIHYNTSQAQAEATAELVRAQGQEATTLQGNLAAPTHLIQNAAQGPLDLLVNNASIFPETTLEEMTWPDLEDNTRINAWAPFLLARDFIAQAPPGASIINLLDTRIGDYDWKHVPYLLSKQMLASMTSMLALHAAPAIRVNAIAPGPILPPPGGDDAYLKTVARALPLQRHGNPDDITRAVRYLIDSPFVTGQILHVDGGRHLGRYRND